MNTILRDCIIVYTHKSYHDVLDACMGRLHAHLGTLGVDIIVFDNDEKYPNTILYDESKPYGERLRTCLEQIKSSYDSCLFMHEDMILYQDINVEIIKKYFDLVKSECHSYVRLIRAEEDLIPTKIETLFAVPDNQLSFNIQPTIISIDSFIEFIEVMVDRSIYSIEQVSGNYLTAMGYLMYVSYNNELKRGMHHYDSNIFPYIATAINKGKWNTTEYKNEISNLAAEYKIDLSIRGTV